MKNQPPQLATPRDKGQAISSFIPCQRGDIALIIDKQSTQLCVPELIHINKTQREPIHQELMSAHQNLMSAHQCLYLHKVIYRIHKILDTSLLNWNFAVYL